MPFVFLQNLEFRQSLGPYHKQSKMQSDSTMTLMSKSQTKEATEIVSLVQKRRNQQ